MSSEEDFHPLTLPDIEDIRSELRQDSVAGSLPDHLLHELMGLIGLLRSSPESAYSTFKATIAEVGESDFDGAVAALRVMSSTIVIFMQRSGMSAEFVSTIRDLLEEKIVQDFIRSQSPTGVALHRDGGGSKKTKKKVTKKDEAYGAANMRLRRRIQTLEGSIEQARNAMWSCKDETGWKHQRAVAAELLRVARDNGSTPS